MSVQISVQTALSNRYTSRRVVQDFCFSLVCWGTSSLAWDEAELLRTSESERLPQEPLAHGLSSSVI